MTKKLLLLFILSSVFFNCSALAQHFQKAYGENPDRQGVFFQSVNDGYVIAGTARDSTYNTQGYYIFKIDKQGNKVWEKQYSNAFSAYTYGLTILRNGNIALIGTHASISYSALAEVMLLDSDGNLLNSQTYPPLDGWGTSGVGIIGNGDSTASITLYTDGFISTNYYSIYRLNQDLSTRWTEFVGYDGSLINNHSLIKTSNGDYFSMCYYDMYTYSPSFIFQVSGIRKFDSSGTVELDSLYQFQVQTVSISPTNDKGSIIGANYDNNGQNDMRLIKMDSTGSVSWTNQFGSYLSESTTQVIQTRDGGYGLIATVPDLILLNQNDILFVKCDSNGDSLWSRKIGSTLNEMSLHLEETADSDFAILGTTTGFGNNKIFFAVLDQSGNVPSNYEVLGNGRYFCSTDSLVLDLTPALDSSSHVLWSNGDTTNTTTIHSTGNYFATITDSLGTSVSTNYYSCFFATTPDVSIGPDTMGICETAELINSFSGDFTIQYQWYLNDTLIPGANDINLKPAGKGIYKLIASNYCTVDSDMVYIDSIYSSPPVPLLTSPSIDYVCYGDSLMITANTLSGYTFQWYTADLFNSFVIPGANDSNYYVANEGVYFVEIEDSFGCSNVSDRKIVSFDNIPPIVNANGPASFCQGGEVHLSTAPGSNFLWSTLDTTNTITVNSAGDYFVSFIDQFGCPKSTDTIAITILANPYVSIGPDTMVCHDDIYVFDAGPGFNNYLWNFGTITQSVAVIATHLGIDTQSVFVFVTDTNGCTNSDTATIIFDICIGVDDLSQSQGVSVYPTALEAGQSIHVSSTSIENAITLYDLSGKVVFRKKFGNALDQVLDLSKGLYFYQINGKDAIRSTGKVIVQ